MGIIRIDRNVPSVEGVFCAGQRFTQTLPTCPLLLVTFVLVLHPLFQSPTGHSGYCWEPNWDWDPDWITVSSEFMVSSVEGIPERTRVFNSQPDN